MEDTSDSQGLNEDIQSQADNIARLSQEVARLKILEKALDIETVKFKSMIGLNVTVATPLGHVRVQDNFAEKNTVFRSKGIKRFETIFTSNEDLLVKVEKERIKSLKKRK